MEPVSNRWALPDREWGLGVTDAGLVLIEKRPGASAWQEVGAVKLPTIIADIEAWIRGTVIPWLQAKLDALFPPAVAPAGAEKTVSDVVAERIAAGAVQYNYTTRRFSYIAPPDPNNV